MNHHHNHHGEAGFKRKVDYLDRPERNELLTPEEFIQDMPVKKTDTILDLGAGTGFLTIPAAKLVDNTVFALDLDSKMLELIQKKAIEDNLINVKVLEASMEEIPLKAGSISIALASLVLHEASSLTDVLTEVNRVVKVGGYFACLEFDTKGTDLKGPPMEIQISAEKLERELGKVGFEVVNNWELGEGMYVSIAEKRR
ncbi:SAM-dependent methyltransferase [Listeria ivanovii]|uniref:class I SAM-dependent methyltransferase n=1 Tax=Listeria ivanovii TaxID=1638 RepID=UPI000DA9C47E|nr:class I SAM-dependent methyltransferase [Listeria ivanovii]PZF88925.1 SAM-dependent methyltransferase [Listeria ivanovii]PZF94139.1 SAM-dependent methyltransferase [Listeria ivanovii]PZG04898.1 SAM-dependent methyltransferase [Listeria ivanovii]PZG09350.1 SAM-dependent methyltransferase [Listeria ivanovii]PZG26274.1 SAM-dependent methyltransferase [Listeria ivanovii]